MKQMIASALILFAFIHALPREQFERSRLASSSKSSGLEDEQLTTNANMEVTTKPNDVIEGIPLPNYKTEKHKPYVIDFDPALKCQGFVGQQMFFPNPNNEHTYFVCVGPKLAVEMPCAEGTTFSDYEGYFNSSTSQTSTDIYKIYDIDEFDETEDYDIDSIQVPIMEHNQTESYGQNDATEKEDLSGRFCKNYDGRFALIEYPEDETKYVVCTSKENAVLMSCPPGTIFNRRISICDFPKSVYKRSIPATFKKRANETRAIDIC